MPALIDGKPNPSRKTLLDMINGTATNPVDLKYILPKFIKVTNRGTGEAVDSLMPPHPDPLSAKLRNIALKMMHGEDKWNRWWEIEEDCSDETYNDILKIIPYADCNVITIYAFNDKMFPSTLSFFTGSG